MRMLSRSERTLLRLCYSPLKKGKGRIELANYLAVSPIYRYRIRSATVALTVRNPYRDHLSAGQVIASF